MLLHVKALVYCIVILRLVVTQSVQHRTALEPTVKEGEVECSEEESCYTEENSLVDTIANIDNELLCQQLCQMRNDCGFYTWFDEQSTSFPRICFHFRKCDDPEPCKASCHSGPPKCPSIIEPTQPTQPEDCSALEDSDPPHGTPDCYMTSEGKKCHMSCDPGYATPGPSVVPCMKSAEATILSCEPSVVLVTGGDQAMQEVEVYSSSTNSCRLSLPSLHGLYSDHSLDYVDGNVLLCGGSTYANMCFTLLPDLTWAPLASNLTTKRTHQASAYYRDNLLLMGGLDDSTEIWSPGTGWEAGQPLPPEASIDGCASRISTHEILLTGGHLCPTCSFVFNWQTGDWRRVGDLSEGRSSHGCASYISPEDGGMRVLVAGGWSGHNIRTAEVFNPATERWRVVGDLTSPRRGLTLATAEGGLVMALGGRYSTAVADVDIFDPEIETWTARPPLLRSRAYHATTSVPASLVGCQLSA